MLNNLFENVNPGFVVAMFLQACGDEQFQNCWMTADTWVKLIEAYTMFVAFNLMTNNVIEQFLTLKVLHNRWILVLTI